LYAVSYANGKNVSNAGCTDNEKGAKTKSACTSLRGIGQYVDAKETSMGTQPTSPLRDRIRRCLLKANGRPAPLILWVPGLVAFYLLFAGLVLPYVLRSVLEKRMSQALHSPSRVESLSFNPFTLTLTASNIAVPYPGDAGMFLRLDRLELTPSLLSFFRLAPGIKELKLDKPVVDLTLFANGEFSPRLFLNALNAGAEEAEAPEGEEQPIFPFIIYGFSINDGTVIFRDQIRNATQIAENINFVVPFASTLPADKDLAVRPQLHATVNGRRLTFTGETRPFSNSLHTEFTLWMEELELNRFRDYIAPYTTLDLKSGMLFASLKLRLSRDEGKPMSIVLEGKAEIADLELAGPQGTAFKTARAGVDLENVRFGMRRIVVNDAFLDSPAVTVRRAADGTVDWRKFFMLPKEDPAPAQVEDAVPPLDLTVTKARIIDGSITWHDASVPGFAPHTLPKIRATLANMRSEGEGKADFSLEFGEGPSQCTAEGKLSVKPLRVEGSVSMDRMPLTPFSRYLTQAAGMSLDSADLGLKGDFLVEQGTKTLVRFSPAEISLRDASVSSLGGKTPVFTAKHLAVGDITADVSAQHVTVGKIFGSGIAAHPVRDASETLAVTEDPASAGAKENEPLQTSAAAAKDNAPRSASGMDWQVTLANVQFDAASISLTDQSLRNMAVLPFSEIKLSASDLSTQPGKQWTANVSVRPGKRGAVRLDAKGTLQPLALSFQCKADNADIAFLSPYLGEHAELSLSEASLNADISGELKSGKGGELDVNVGGDAGLQGVSLTEGRKEFGGWGRLHAEKFQYHSVPGSVGALSIGTLHLNGPRISVTLGKDGTNSIQRVLRQAPAKTVPEVPAAPKAKAASPAHEPPAKPVGGFSSLSIGGFRVTGGEIRLRDEGLQPSHSLKADGISMNMKKLSSNPASRGEFEGGLRLNGSPITFNGELNPLITLPAGKFKVDIKTFDLAALSGYSAKFTGYPIRKGELSAEINVALDGLKLDARNDLVIRKLDFGDKDRSSDAPDMPVKMAVSLLSDLNGDISLSLPVAGRLDDPQFRLGGIMGKVIANVMLKTVTSPISLLGGVFNLFTGAGGADLERIAFAPGEDRLDSRALDSLRTLAQALAKRPSIKLELIGVADMLEKADIAAADVLKKMREMKYNSLPKAERVMTTPDKMRVGPDVDAEEYAALLSQIYAAGRFAKPEGGAVLSRSTREMMHQLRRHAVVSDGRVGELADARAKAVYDEVVRIDASLAGRITISPSQITPDDGAERKVDSSVLTKMKSD